jgi:deferrochelatase/peroxidase EfeB
LYAPRGEISQAESCHRQALNLARDNTSPHDRASEFDIPDYATDPDGNVILLDAHIRLANPRTPATANQRIVRRSYNYDLGVDANCNLQAGHMFVYTSRTFVGSSKPSRSG